MPILATHNLVVDVSAESDNSLPGEFFFSLQLHRMRTRGRRPTVHVVTLGCSKNLADSEQLLAQLAAAEWPVAVHGTPRRNDIIIINTCGFIEQAKQESINTILDFAERKKQNRISRLYVTGCLSQRYRHQLEQEIPEVDAWFGTLELPQLLKHLGTDYRHDLVGEHYLTTPSHYAYVKISEGCNRICSFCAIPLMRGPHRSKPMEAIEQEVRSLVSRGVVEVMLIAQELTYYGLDLYRRRMLAELLRRLADIEGLAWLRLHYAYPAAFPMDVLDVMQQRSNICRYLDIPFQHISDGVLNRMRRQITRHQTYDLIQRIRDRLPDMTLRTTLLTGFPGETEQDHEQLLRFVEDIRFDRLGIFTYSHEEDTAAHALEDDVPPEVKERRAQEIMTLQQNISLQKNEALIGQTLRVLLDRREGAWWMGRSEGDSPEVDNEVWVADAAGLAAGRFADVCITDAAAYDLFGRVAGHVGKGPASPASATRNASFNVAP
ncbi:MAG: 30S ribosomal protein S12 methylthiotransferase RimO [Chitinophagales bacterium]|nr:30S ribosomal protein S12 methylthiotransferase RimO [Chitinophagales bacterium]MDW8393204.1 30S ribosomal protein S12 methylthiotransferase RimO [Chitinophagales bacterium]